jgi:hypothetical protein
MAEDDLPLVAGRDCGGCTACCVDLKIEDPALAKPAGETCRHCTGDGCGIYDRRPMVCQAFQCGWRRLPWLGDAWRPDRSGILIRSLDPAEACPDDPAADLALSFDLRRADRGLIGMALAEACATLIDAEVATFLTVPGAPGAEAGRIELNVPLGPAVAARDGEAILLGLELAFEAAALYGR